jgi:hypothetical protein
VRGGHLLIETEASLSALDTEKILINFGKANLLDKARQQPQKVMQNKKKRHVITAKGSVTSLRMKLKRRSF